jgi:DNA-binding response OmpR family regulator
VKGGSPIVLAVSDHEDSLAMYAIGLLASGLQVTTAERGEQAITRAQACRPDVIVVDERLPDVPFEEFIHRLREDARTTNTLIIGLTSRPSDSGRAWSGADGCDLYLRIPCPPDTLGLAIQKLLAHDGTVHRVSRAGNAG